MHGWDWRKSSLLGVAMLKGDTGRLRIFHAYDRNDHAACDPVVGLLESTEPPNEGSEFCAECMAIVRVTPAPPKKDYAVDGTG